jgi:hypothetical protein
VLSVLQCMSDYIQFQSSIAVLIGAVLLFVEMLWCVPLVVLSLLLHLY